MRRLTDPEIAALVVNELPEPLRGSPVIDRGVRRLQDLNRADPQSGLAGLHRLVDFHLSPLVLANPSAAAAHYIALLVRDDLSAGAPLAMKLAALLVLEPHDRWPSDPG